jgi:hypothetical protein
MLINNDKSATSKLHSSFTRKEEEEWRQSRTVRELSDTGFRVAVRPSFAHHCSVGSRVFRRCPIHLPVVLCNVISVVAEFMVRSNPIHLQ